MAKKAASTPDRCGEGIVKVARAQARATLREAEANLKKHKGLYPRCELSLETARMFIEDAGKSKGSALDRRNAYVRATYHAGQAKLCPVVTRLETEQLETRGRKGKKRGPKMVQELTQQVEKQEGAE